MSTGANTLLSRGASCRRHAETISKRGSESKRRFDERVSSANLARVAMPIAVPAAPTRHERSKAARRQRTIDAVLELASQGGYDAVQIRAASELSGVASDTIYRYFGSRDALISAALLEWLEREAFQEASHWGEGDTAAEQLLAAHRHAWELWERNPTMLETFVRATLADGHRADGPAARAKETMTPLVADILRDVDADYRDDVMTLLEHLTHSAMHSIVQGQLAINEVFPLLERAIRRLAQHPAMAGHCPPSWAWQPEAAGKRHGKRR
jgi:AcrR family transcriptional regulator